MVTLQKVKYKSRLCNQQMDPCAVPYQLRIPSDLWPPALMLILLKRQRGRSRALSVLYKTQLRPHLVLIMTSTLALRTVLMSEIELAVPEVAAAMEAPLLADKVSSQDLARWALQANQLSPILPKIFSILWRFSPLWVMIGHPGVYFRGLKWWSLCSCHGESCGKH